MSVDIYCNEGLVEHRTYHAARGDSAAVVQALREKWALLRELSFAADYPVEVLVGADGHGDEVKVVELFRWRSLDHRAEAALDERCRKVQAWVDALARSDAAHERFTGVIRGFNRSFPSSGGTELLHGVCSCTLSIEDKVNDFPLSVKGVVVMHRSPGADFDGDGRREMYFDLFVHGGEVDVDGFGPVRVSQNFDVPNDGIVKSNGEGDMDFPGTAIWRIGWKLQTPLGQIVTDPDAPLVFGPALMAHYPPVGMHFHSSTGPVALLHVDSGQQIGTLTPGELGPFDVIATKDDEAFAGYPSRPVDVLELLESHTKAAATA